MSNQERILNRAAAIVRDETRTDGPSRRLPVDDTLLLASTNKDDASYSQDKEEEEYGVCISSSTSSSSATTATATTIRPMPVESRQRIVAGQAILDLASCVKELLDNALDAQSKSINIRLFNKGLDIVEVSDDGLGVPMASRSALALPHATSKITSFEDIYNTNIMDPNQQQQRPSTTLGFRGEALYSLANLSTKLVVATRTASDAVAQKMEYRRDGSLVLDSVTDMPRKIGTTVAVLGVLQAVPVRRRDLEHRMAQHRTKLIQFVTEYAIFSTGVRIHLMDMIMTPPNGGGGCQEKTILATASNNEKLQDTVSSVLGTKFVMAMSPITVDLSAAAAGDSLSETANEPETDTASPIIWKMEGLIYSAAAAAAAANSSSNSVSSNTGRRERQPKGQYFSINRRPVDLPKLSRLLNETFRSFGSGDRCRPPACVLEFSLPGTAYDINLSPDKRQVILTHEACIHLAIQKAVEQLWSSQMDGQQQFQRDAANMVEPVAEAASSSLLEEEEFHLPEERDEMGDSTSSCRLFARRYAFVHDPNTAVAKELDDGQRRAEYENSSPRSKRSKSMDSQWKISQNQPSATPNNLLPQEVDEMGANATANLVPTKPLAPFAVPDSLLSNTVTPSPAFRVGAAISGQESRSNQQQRGETNIRKLDVLLPSSHLVATEHRVSEHHQGQNARDELNHPRNDEGGEASNVLNAQGINLKAAVDPLSKKISFETTNSSAPDAERVSRKRNSFGLEKFGFRVVEREVESFISERSSTQRDPSIRDALVINKSLLPNVAAQSNDVGSVIVEAPVSKATFESSSPEIEWKSFQGTNSVIMASFRDRKHNLDRKRQLQRLSSLDSEIERLTNTQSKREPDSNSISITKEDFKGMTVVGQFNLGFILARSPTGSLWILDQHACDEKYNFEKLCSETIIREQTLIAPMALELSASEETCILDSMDIFKQNGFRFQYDETKPCRHRLSVTALPHSGARDGRNAVQYGKDDVLALCSILNSDDGTQASSSLTMEHGGTGTDGTGRYGNNAVRRYVSGTQIGESADRIIARLPKTIAMFASRSCRSSVMIGTPLSDREMEKIVQRLADIKHPWNCPHGRPTMRHVCDLQGLMAADQRRASNHVAGPTVTLMTQDGES